MKDLTGIELKIGDKIIYITGNRCGKYYLETGTVTNLGKNLGSTTYEIDNYSYYTRVPYIISRSTKEETKQMEQERIDVKIAELESAITAYDMAEEAMITLIDTYNPYDYIDAEGADDITIDEARYLMDEALRIAKDKIIKARKKKEKKLKKYNEN